jgi:hypothetical protein
VAAAVAWIARLLSSGCLVATYWVQRAVDPPIELSAPRVGPARAAAPPPPDGCALSANALLLLLLLAVCTRLPGIDARASRCARQEHVGQSGPAPALLALHTLLALRLADPHRRAASWRGSERE